MEMKGLIEEKEGTSHVSKEMSEKYLPMHQTETTQLEKLCSGGDSQAELSTEETTNSSTDKSSQANKSTRSDNNGKDVFLSHSGKQKFFVRQLYTDLTNEDVSCFFDQDPESLPLAEDFPSIIFEAVKTCKVAVLLLSKDFLETKWPMLELSAFVEVRDTSRTNPNLKILPLFFQISPAALKDIDAYKKKWEKLGISGEEQAKWAEALKVIRRLNGLTFSESDNEVEFREKTVKDILHFLPPSQRYHIPSMQGEVRMCQEVTDFFHNVRRNKKRILIAGLYGIAGYGKTTLGKAFCNIKLRDFDYNVCHLEFSRGDSFQRRKLALQYLTQYHQSPLQTLTQDQAKLKFYKRVKDKRVLLVLDNITEENTDEVQYYIEADFSANSCILLSTRSLDVLVKHFKIDSQSCMHVPSLQEDDAIAILLESTSPEVSTLGAEDKAFALKCANRCLFSCDIVRRFHPLALKAFGRHLFSKHGSNLSKWVAEIDGMVDSGYGLDDVLVVLGKAFDDMCPKYRTIFMLLTVYNLPNMSPHKVTEWLAINCNKEIPFINKAVEDLSKKAFIEEFEPEIRIHDLYIEFAQSKAKEMGRWLWWKGDQRSTCGLSSEDNAGFELAKVEQCKHRNPSQIVRKYVQNLLVLQLVGVQNMRKLDLAQMNSLRSITLLNCENLAALEGIENLVELAWLQISEVNPMFKLQELSSLQGLQHLEIDIGRSQVVDQLGDLTPCFNLKRIKVLCPSLLEFPRLNGLPYLEKVEFTLCNEVKGPLDCTNCEMLQSIVLNGCRQMFASPVLAGCKKITKLVLSDCDAVTACPDIDVPSALKTLEFFISSRSASAPKSLESCDGLENLKLWNMGELKELPSFNRLSNLTELKIGKCGIREPPDLTCCVMLENVYFYTLKYLKRFPNFSLLGKLKILFLYNCRTVQDPPDISGCRQLQVFHLVCNDSVKGLPNMHECAQLDDIKVSWHGKDDEVTYDGIVPDSCEVDDDFQSCLEHFKDEIPLENLNDVFVPTQLREWLRMQEKRWRHGRILLVKQYFRGMKLYYSVTVPYEFYKSSNCYRQNYITLRLVDSKVIAFPTPGRACDRDWLKKVREYFAGKDDIACASAASECENAEAISLPLPPAPSYYVPLMQGQARMCQEVTDFFNTSLPNEKGIYIAGLYGTSGLGKSTLGRAFCNLNLGNFNGKVLYVEFCGGNVLDGQKLALHYLTHCCTSQFEGVTSEDDVRSFFCTKVEGQRVLLVLDNITEDSIDKVRAYLGAELGKDSYILLTARSPDVLTNFTQSCMHVPRLEKEEAIAMLLEGTSLQVAEPRGFALKCANSCSFKEDTAFAPTFHPLALKAFGRHLFSKHHFDLSKWVAETDGFADRARDYLDVVFAVLDKAYADMGPRYRTIIVLLAQSMPPKLSSDECIEWLARNCNEDIKYIKEAVEDLCKRAFIEEIEPEIRMHDLINEFVHIKENEGNEGNDLMEEFALSKTNEASSSSSLKVKKMRTSSRSSLKVKKMRASKWDHNIKASLIEARKASYGAYNSKHGYVWQDIGNNTVCLAFSGSLESTAFRQTDTKFGVCKINEGNNYFVSMVDGTTRKANREPALVYREGLKKFLHIWGDKLKLQVADALGRGKTVLFSGHSIGGAIATLAALKSLGKFGKNAPVFATTFGFPLIGDEVLARAVRRQGWDNHFFNVVSRGDIFARTLLAPCTSVSSPLEALLPYWEKSVKQINDDDTDILMEPADFFPMYLRTVLHHACAVVNFISATNMEPANKLIASLKPAVKLCPYRAFGYYLFCSDRGVLCVENYEAVLPILFYSLATAQDQASISDHTSYGRVFNADTNIVDLEGLPNLALSQGEPLSAMEIQLDALGLGIQNTGARIALRAAGEVEHKLIETWDILKAQLVEMVEEAGHMTKLKEYRNKCANERNMGYYDAFKEQEEPDFHANLNRLNLAAFYDRLEEMVENHQVPDDFQFIEELIKDGTEYRLLVEPLDIANYYRLGKHEDSGHYLKNARPRRYKALEKWLADIQVRGNNQDLLHYPPGITKDSCFWARVEEISWLMSNPRENPEAVRTKCAEFQEYVKQMMERNELCVEEVVKGESSFVKWWKKLSPQEQQASPISSIFR